MVWATDSGRVEPLPDAPSRAVLVPDALADANVEARLELRGRVLARTIWTVPGLPAPRAAVVAGRVHVAEAGEIEWWGSAPPRLPDGTYRADAPLVGLRARRGERTSPWTWLSGGLPGPAGAVDVPLPADGCADPTFPRRGGGDHFGCTEEGRLDRVLRAGRRAVHPLPEEARPRASRSIAAPGALVWVDADVGRWTSELEVYPLHGGRLVGRPAADSERTVFARADRIEVMERGTSRRTQIPATPLDGASVVAVDDDRLAWIEGTTAHGALRLRRLDLHRDGTIARGKDLRAPTLRGGRALFIDDGRPRALPLRGGVDRTWPLAADADGSTAVLDDWWIVGVRGGDDPGDLWAIHLPSGVAAPWLVGPGAQSPRGAGAGAVTWRDGDGAPRLRTVEAPVRVFEEDGSARTTGGGRALTGGHGGSRIRLDAGETLRLTLPHVDPASSLACFREAGAGTITLQRSGRTIEVPLPAPEPAATPAWYPLPKMRGDVGDPLVIEFRGGRGGLDVDAVRVAPRDGGAR